MKYRVALLFVFILIWGCSEEVAPTKPLLEFVPEQASLVLKINDFTTFKNQVKTNDFLSDLRDSKIFDTALDKIRFMEFIQPMSASILAFVETEKGSFESIYITSNSPNLMTLDSVQEKRVEQIEFKGTPLLKYEVNKAIFYSSELANKVLISSSPDVIKNLRVKLKDNRLPETLKKLYKASNNYKTASVYINVKKSNPFLLSVLKSDTEIDISNFSDWMSLDFNLKPTNFNLNGIGVTNDSVWNYVDLFANTKPLARVTPLFAPEGTDALISYTFDDYEVFARNQQGFLKGAPTNDPLFGTVEEVGVIFRNNQKTIVLSTHGSETMAEYLDSTKKGTIDYQGSQILKLQNALFLNKVLNPLVQDFKANFCTIIKNAFVFSETRESLEFIIRNHKNGSTYDKTTIYQTVKNSLAEESNLLFISNSNSLKKILKADLSSDFNEDLAKTLLSQYAVAAQTTADKNFYHTNIVIQKNEKEVGKNGVAQLFLTKLDTAVATSPQFVTNHITKKKEVVVQDYKNVLYLISSDGKILWKKQLDALVQGKIHQVDIFKNGRLQLAFTTNNQLMVLDRNGKEVRRFTKTFEGGNLNPLAVFDYDGKRDYRFVITQGAQTFMYNSKAAIVDGFKYTKAEKPILAAPKHLRIGRKDFLVFKLNDGSLKILNRVGDVRTAVKQPIDFSENEVYLNKDKFTLTDKKGTLYQIDQSGKTTKTNFNLSNDHGMYATGNTLVLMNENILTIKGKKVELELGVYSPPKVFYIHNKIYVGVTDLQSERVFLFDSQAKPIPNFPVFGTSLVDLNDIDNDKIPEMVVTGENNTIISYKLN